MSSDLKEVLAPLTQERETLLEREQELREQADDVRAERMKIERVLRAGGLIAPATTKPKGSNGNGPIDVDKENIVRKAIKDYEVGEKFTQTMVDGNTVGISPPYIARVIDALRASGEVRLVGKVRGGGRAYAITDSFQGVIEDG